MSDDVRNDRPKEKQHNDNLGNKKEKKKNPTQEEKVKPGAPEE